jgi:mannitol/fructose-specific phosphotransferase system IIA component
MTILTPGLVKLGAKAVDKVEAIRLAGDLLVRAGCVAPGYLDGMLRREASMSTYLGAGVAIPHGTFDDRELVKRTGISFVQVPAGIEWEPGETVRLVIGIAASADDHVDLLQRLAEVVEEERLVRRLVHASDPAAVVEILDPPDRSRPFEG